MGKVNELWQDCVESICDSFAEGRLSHDEAFRAMRGLGFEFDEIDDWLTAAREQYREANGQFGVGA